MINVQQIKQWNLQRYPINLVDSIESFEIGKNIHAIKAVTAIEPCYSHIKDNAPLEAMAYPKSLLIESFCQASGPLCAMSGLKYEGRYALFISMRNVEFSGHVYPGDVIEHKAEIIFKSSPD